MRTGNYKYCIARNSVVTALDAKHLQAMRPAELLQDANEAGYLHLVQQLSSSSLLRRAALVHTDPLVNQLHLSAIRYRRVCVQLNTQLNT